MKACKEKLQLPYFIFNIKNIDAPSNLIYILRGPTTKYIEIEENFIS